MTLNKRKLSGKITKKERFVMVRLVVLLTTLLLFSGCFSESDFGNMTEDSEVSRVNDSDKEYIEAVGETIESSIAEKRELTEVSTLAFKRLDRNLTTSEVRDIIDVFAFGGFATEEQIVEWSKMSPEVAIEEILNFKPSNLKLSPADSHDRLDKVKGRDIISMAKHWSSSKKTPSNLRENYTIDNYNSFEWTVLSMLNRRGLNPFKEKIALFETDTHFGFWRDKNSSNTPIFRNYNDISESLINGLRYSELLSIGSLSLQSGEQFGYINNRFYDGQFIGNEQFSRVFHQQIFRNRSDISESEIRASSKLLTGVDSGSEYLGFSSSEHYVADLIIFDKAISGDNGKEKLFNLSKVAIEQNSSLENLPIYILESIADSNLSDEVKRRAVDSWAMLDENRSILRFLQAYAISEDFHSPHRYKLRSSFDREVYIQNRITINSRESYLDLYKSVENIEYFDAILSEKKRTGEETLHSMDEFRKIYNRSTEGSETFLQASDDELLWNKDWTERVPESIKSGDLYFVKDVAEWLWNYVVGDELQNYGEVEKAHLIALLNGKDLGYFLNPADPERVYSSEDLNSSETVEKILDGGNGVLYLNSSDSRERERANRNINRAFTFIIATPYIYIER
jgi:hypothetical protein